MAGRGRKGLRVTLAQQGPIPLDIDLSCAPGELLALVGPSGSGKSTVLRAIAGLVDVASGQVECGEERWFDSSREINIATRHRRVGFVFQSYALFPHMTALANIMEAVPDDIDGDREARAKQLLDQVRLDGLGHRRPAQLSGGQQQRVAVARALARSPEVLLLDEPFSAVDRVTRQRLYLELGQLRGQLRMPAILVTHDLDEAMQLCDRMAILYRGQILQDGPPAEVLGKPSSRVVARLVDQKNIFDASISGLDTKSGTIRLDWHGKKLDVRAQAGYREGEAVDWIIPPGAVILHRRRAPSRGVRENPLKGVIDSMIRLGDLVSVRIVPENAPSQPLFMSIPAHAAERNGLAPGEQIGVSLRKDEIHLMKKQADDFPE